MPQLFANNAASTLAAAITAADTSLTLATGTGSKFPSPAAGDFFLLTLTQAGQETSWEIVKVTARAGDVLTVVRAQEGGVAAAWGIGAKAELRITAGALDAKQATLVSGTNIKTINGNSVLGSGDLVISGGGGSSALTIDNKTSAYTVVASDLGKIINCTSETFTVSLTAAATLGAGFNCWVWNTSSTEPGAITIDPSGSETIDGATTLVLRRGEGLQIVCDGTKWQTGDKKAMRGYSENLLPGSPPSATGNYSIAIGPASSASSTLSFSIQGDSGASYGFAIGRNSNNQKATTVTGAGAMALGGSYASGTDSFAAAIANNTSSYGATGVNSVAFGLRAKASGSGSFSFGEDSQATSLRAVAFGYQTVATGTFSPFAVGYQNTASGSYSVALGANALAAQYGKQTFASGRFSANGDAQSGKMVLRGVTTDATATVLTSDGAGPGATNQLILPANGAIHFNIRVIARQRDLEGQGAAGYTFTGVASRSGSGGNVSLLGSAKTVDFESDATWDCIILEDDTNAAIAISVTGVAGKSVRWVAVVEVVEVIYG